MSDELHPGSDPLLGRVVAGKWTVVRLLGTGGTASVYEAVHRNGKRVAIKLLAPERAADAVLRDRFLREGYTANRVGHPRVVSVDDDGVEPDGTAFLVMDLLSGEALDRMAERVGGSLAWPIVAQIADQLLEVLERAHALGIVHRDLKPANLFWSSAGLRVLDFGLARVMDASPEVTRTRDGAVLGTPAFMSPEQARAAAAQVGPSTDLWAVGATAFTLLTGRKVHEATSVDEQIALAATQSAPSLRRLVAEAPPALLDVFQRALEHDPADRFVSATAMRAALREAVTSTAAQQPRDLSTEDTLLDSSRSAHEGSEVAAHPASKRLTLLLLVAAMVVAVVGLAASRHARFRPNEVHASAPGSEVAPESAVMLPSPPSIAPLVDSQAPLPSATPRASNKPRVSVPPSASATTTGSSDFIEQPPF